MRGHIWLLVGIIFSAHVSAVQSEYLNADSGYAGWGTFGHIFIGSSTANGDGDSNSDGDIDALSGNAWGLYNVVNSPFNADYSEAGYAFSQGPLQVGQTLRIQMDTGVGEDHAYAGAVGIQFISVGLRTQFFYQPTMSATYMLGGGSGQSSYNPENDTGIPYTDEGLALSFELLTAETYKFSVTVLESGQTYVFDNRTLNPYLAGTPIIGINLFSVGNGEGAGHERAVYFNNLEIVPEPGTLRLLALGGLALIARLARSRQ